jgi:hypothetical protein
MGWALAAGWVTVAGLVLLAVGTGAQAWANLSEYRDLFRTATESARKALWTDGAIAEGAVGVGISKLHAVISAHPGGLPETLQTGSDPPGRRRGIRPPCATAPASRRVVNSHGRVGAHPGRRCDPADPGLHQLKHRAVAAPPRPTKAMMATH